jgi:death on curing protein
MHKEKYISFCHRCYHTWQRRKEKLPKVCPKCKSPYWYKPRKRAVKELILKMKEDIIQIHNAIIKLSGGTNGIREDGGIYNSTYKFLNYQYKHKGDASGLGAFILNEFAKRHYFVDGNKRTAYATAKIFMLVNRCHFQTEYSEAVPFILEVAKDNSKITFDEIKRWLKKDCKIIEEKDIKGYLKDVLVNLIIGVKNNERRC